MCYKHKNKSHCQLIPCIIRFLQRNFMILKGLLNYIINNDIMLLFPSSNVLILPFREKKFFIGGLRVILIRTNKLAIIGCLDVLVMVRAINQPLCHCLSFLKHEVPLIKLQSSVHLPLEKMLVCDWLFNFLLNDGVV